ncbi:hypothetical protein C8N24_5570 [Solirubrobacter pauli]|uniref:Uncharacterized protein n=2 Tax=Solirubrobacter pauli TaxID=166793 RepID=A0A660L2K6_9ACTN|nr:hypothetical protein C8N24_5570 [Solirubrobacter pauli]
MIEMADFRTRLERELVQAAARPSRLRYARSPLPGARGATAFLAFVAATLAVVGTTLMGGNVGPAEERSAGPRDEGIRVSPRDVPLPSFGVLSDASSHATPSLIAALRADAGLKHLDVAWDELRVASRTGSPDIYVAPARDGHICLLATVTGESPEFACKGVAEAAAEALTLRLPGRDASTLIGLAPDGVAGVAISADDGSRVVVPVLENTFVASPVAEQVTVRWEGVTRSDTTPDPVRVFSRVAQLPTTASREADRLRENMARVAQDRFAEIRVALQAGSDTVYVAWGKQKVCLWHSRGSGGVMGCSTISQAADPRTPLVVTTQSREGGSRDFFALVPDAVTGALVPRAGGSPERVYPTANVLAGTGPAGGRIELLATDGRGTILIPRR